MYKKALYSLMTLLVIFSCIFFVALANFIRKVSFFNLGFSYFWENIIIGTLSLIGIFRVIFEIIIADRK